MEARIHVNTWQDLLALTKPRVVLLHLITATAAMFLAARGLPPTSILTWTLVGGGLMVGASNALNCYFDRNLDSMMDRTRSRPLPAGRMEPEQARIFSIIIAFAGLFILTKFVSWQTALLALGALAYYVPFYTLWLKRHTAWSAVIGSGAGAFPPLIGWIAVTGRIELTPFLLFAIVALWSPPHFWSLVIVRRNDYQHAGLDAIPAGKTPLWIMIFSSLMIVFSLILKNGANLGPVYMATAVVLDLIFLILTMRLYLKPNARTARYLHLYSIGYLSILFVTMVVDTLLYK